MTLTPDELRKRSCYYAEQLGTDYSIQSTFVEISAEICERLDTLIEQGKDTTKLCGNGFINWGGTETIYCNQISGHSGSHSYTGDLMPQGQSVAENLAGMQEYVRELEKAAEYVISERDRTQLTVGNSLCASIQNLQHVINVKLGHGAESGTGEDG